MRLATPILAIAALLAPIVAQSTQQWSACQTISGVSNYIAYGSSVLVTLSPGISGCSPADIPGATVFTVGVNGITTDNINSFLATGLAAYSAGHQVMVYYDNSTTNCQGLIVSVGGPSGQCP